MKQVGLLGGDQRRTAFARVNRYWRRLLEQQGWSVSESPSAPIVIHHDYSQDFPQVELSPEVYRIAVRTWDFGPFPSQWVGRLQSHWDELWVHCGWVRSQAIAAGVPESVVRVLPHGVDQALLAGDLPPFRWERPEQEFRFLFVGASVHRKGIDTLLKAYRLAFTSADPVCLVIKDHTRDVFYQGIDYRDEILREEPGWPAVVYLDEYLEDAALASLFHSCHAGVFPYRAEGFAMPILEAMACGLPCLVPGFGACLDFCDRDNAILVPVRRIALPVGQGFSFNTLGFETEVQEVDYCEIRLEALAEKMREVFATDRAALRARGLRASERIRQGWTWGHVGRLLESYLENPLSP